MTMTNDFSAWILNRQVGLNNLRLADTPEYFIKRFSHKNDQTCGSGPKKSAYGGMLGVSSLFGLSKTSGTNHEEYFLNMITYMA